MSTEDSTKSYPESPESGPELHGAETGRGAQRLRAVWVFFAIAILTLSCSAESEEAKSATEAASQPPSPASSAGISEPIRRVIGGGTQLPADAPFFPGAQIEETGPGPDGRVKQVSISPAPAKTVYDTMAEQLEKKGWKIHSRMSDKGQFALDASKEDRRVAVLIADGKILKNAGTSGTRITVLVAP